MKRRYLLSKRGKVWYYKFADEKTYHSTGQTTRAHAEQWIERHTPQGLDLRLRDYLESYYVWDKCPLIAHRQQFGPSMGHHHVALQRSRLERYVFPEPIAEMKLQELRRRDVLDWLNDLERQYGAGSANSALGALKPCLRHAVFREDMERDVMFGISTLKNVQYRERGVLTPKELQDMFYNVQWWKHDRERIALMLGGFAGLRRGEILALQWGDVSFDGGYITVQRAWKNWPLRELGLPKWGKKRVVPMPDGLKNVLLDYRSFTKTPENKQCIISWDDGSWVSPRTVGWWMDNALKAMEIDKRARNLTPHSLRHTFVTFLEQSGLRELSIQAIAGHSDARTTKLYKHPDPTYLVEEMKGVSLLSPPAAN